MIECNVTLKVMIAKISYDLQKYLDYKRRNSDTKSETKSTNVGSFPSADHAAEDVGTRMISQTVGVNVNRYSYFAAQFGDRYLNLKMRMPYDPRITLLRINPRKKSSYMCIKRCVMIVTAVSLLMP
jgi:hypothetical protein